ncbi:sporulation protein [Paenibacillus silviterrae]|uniref:sporulation protein n=1 Tax=Paenibacillus silviterrae TaxID=3242194 RepID=UPI002543C117|nr:sporulation protein [Paenibacillus chinjuensis]
MSFFKKMMASVGIGSATVDTRLESVEVVIGEELRGVVAIRGGQLEQQIDNIYLYIKTHYIKEENDTKVTKEAEVAKYLITEGFVLKPNETREIPFAVPVPDRTPVSYRSTRVWLETGLDIKMALDPTDRDYMEVRASDSMQVILDALDVLGFRLREVTNEYAPRLGMGLPFVQEFEFVPTSKFRGSLDELEVLFFPRGDDLELYMQIDRKARGLRGIFAEAMEMDESFIRFTIPGSELRHGAYEAADRLEQLIARYI